MRLETWAYRSDDASNVITYVDWMSFRTWKKIWAVNVCICYQYFVPNHWHVYPLLCHISAVYFSYSFHNFCIQPLLCLFHFCVILYYFMSSWSICKLYMFWCLYLYYISYVSVSYCSTSHCPSYTFCICSHHLSSTPSSISYMSMSSFSSYFWATYSFCVYIYTRYHLCLLYILNFLSYILFLCLYLY
jgi:hypothetical protein